MRDVAVIVPAGGRSVRFGGERNKLEEVVWGETVLSRTVAAFRGRGDVAMVVVPASPGMRGQAEAIAAAGSGACVVVCDGGACRAESVRAALREVPAGVEWVAVHDGARPLVSKGLIDRVFAAAREHGAAVPGMAVSLTVKEVAGPLPARVVRNVPRAGLWAMQTPQVMRRRDLVEGFERCPIPLEQVTDDVQLLEMIGREVWVVEGEERNLKITTRMDLMVAEWWLGVGRETDGGATR